MPPFNPNAERNVFALPDDTRQQIQALRRKRNLAAREVVILAVAELHQRELGAPDRDLAAEVDALRAEVARLAHQS